MINEKAKCCVLLILGILFLINPVFADINTIRSGETVFIGEQGLNVISAMGSDTQIGWWASGASIAGSAPDYSVNVATPGSFYISPTEFSSRTGSWYALPSKTLAFIVADPQLDILVEDTTVNVDVTDKWVPTDDELRFRIDTNLYPIGGRSGQSWTPVTIKVQSPGGAVFSALLDKNGAPTSIVDYHITTTPQYTDSIWSTNNRAAYPPGTYSIWAECNVNSMKDNYGVTGKTISRKVSLLNQDQNPLIGVNVPTTNPTQLTINPTSPTSTPTKKVTTLSTPIPTISSTPVPTLTATTVISDFPTTAEIAVTPQQPTPTKTKAAGFEAILAGFALVAVLVFCIKKE